MLPYSNWFISYFKWFIAGKKNERKEEQIARRRSYLRLRHSRGFPSKLLPVLVIISQCNILRIPSEPSSSRLISQRAPRTSKSRFNWSSVGSSSRIKYRDCKSKHVWQKIEKRQAPYEERGKELLASPEVVRERIQKYLHM